ncbi:PilZ domain-containing protein [Methylobacterium sp. WL116]|uniref:PilZ domain-containing protein n=1 Tax=Methylobacterium sp. WL116 TaxID=2603889 RepID=UPI0011CB7E89|nr:PilZ domain-containing protein [Methylobacterium sp. WL116]TXM91481.1 pilus assembly protein PilZ [Methylobacterium sp. WL116]
MIETYGKFLLETNSEATCVAIISTSARVEVRRRGGLPAVRLGMNATCYLDAIGVVPGRISEVSSAGFTLLVEASAERKARIDDRLAWLRAHVNDTADQRNDPRIVPTRRAVSVTLSNGQTVGAEIVDLSMSGVALATSERPDPGSAVTVGKRFATVVRHTADGIAVRFKLPYSPTTFNEQAVL